VLGRHVTLSASLCTHAQMSKPHDKWRYTKEGNTMKPGHWYLFLAKSVRLTKGAVARLL